MKEEDFKQNYGGEIEITLSYSVNDKGHIILDEDFIREEFEARFSELSFDTELTDEESDEE